MISGQGSIFCPVKGQGSQGLAGIPLSGRKDPGRPRLLPLVVLACALAVSGCSSTEKAWDSVFGSDSEADVANEPEGLKGVAQRSDYDQNATRRQPTSRYALTESAKPAPEVAKTAEKVIEQQPVPAPAGMESQAPAPLAAAVEPPVAEAGGSASVPEPVQPQVLSPSVPSSVPAPADDMSSVPAFVQAPPGCGGDDLGTTVIGGDGRVSVEPGVPSGCGGAASSPFPGSNVSSLVATIQFASSSATLTAEDRRILRDVASMQRRYGGTLRVVGHASARTANMSEAGHNRANQEVSSRRANAVGEALVAMGVPVAQVYVTAAGDLQPVYQEVMPSGEAGNRRAEVYLDSIASATFVP